MDTAADRGAPAAETDERRRPRWRRRVAWSAVAVLLALVATVAGSALWVWAGSSGHRHDSPADVQPAPVAIVFGAELAPDRRSPKPWLAARLDAAVELIKSGRSQVVLVSGDAHGRSGDEIAAMTGYLVNRGVPAASVVADPYGLDSYDTCARAISVFGVRKAILVSQYFHIPRAVTLCRELGMDADGVGVSAPGPSGRLYQKRAREYLADVKAVLDSARDRPPAVNSAPSDAVTRALRTAAASR